MCFLIVFKDQKSDKGLNKQVNRSVFLPEDSRGESVSALSSCGGCPRSLGCSPLSASPGSAISYLYNLSSFVKSYTSVSDYNWESFFILRILIDSIGLIWITQATLHFTMFNFIISSKSPLTRARMESQVPG